MNPLKPIVNALVLLGLLSAVPSTTQANGPQATPRSVEGTSSPASQEYWSLVFQCSTPSSLVGPGPLVSTQVWVYGNAARTRFVLQVERVDRRDPRKDFQETFDVSAPVPRQDDPKIVEVRGEGVVLAVDHGLPRPRLDSSGQGLLGGLLGASVRLEVAGEVQVVVGGVKMKDRKLSCTLE